MPNRSRQTEKIGRFNSIRTRVMTLVALFCIGIILIIAYSFFSEADASRDVLGNSLQQNLLQAKENIDYRMSEITSLSNSICTDPEMLSAVEHAYRHRSSGVYTLDDYYSLRPRMVNYAVTYPNYRICIYMNENVYMTAEETYFFPIRDIESEAWYGELFNRNGAASWILDESGPGEDDKTYLCLARLLKSRYSNTNLGVLWIGLPISFLSTSFENIVRLAECDARMLGADDEIILHYAHETFSGAQKDAKPQSDRDILREVNLSYGGYKLSARVPFHIVISRALTRSIKMLALLVICFSVICVFLTVLFNNLIRRINNLSDNLANVQNNRFDQLIELKQADELGRVEESFNHMSARIQELINEVYILDIKRKEARMITLQAQIKPHFLYNILDSINWMAWEGNTAEISRVVTALGKFFRLSLSSGEDMVSVQDEIDITRQYILLQQVRYQNAFDVVYNVREDVMQYRCLKLLLQPIVENAIKHGILPSKHLRKGLIEIGISALDGMVYATVVNNSPYVESAEDHEAPKQGGYGLTNVRERLAMQYEDGYSLSIFSNAEGFTEVNISWPAEKYDNGEGAD